MTEKFLYIVPGVKDRISAGLIMNMSHESASLFESHTRAVPIGLEVEHQEILVLWINYTQEMLGLSNAVSSRAKVIGTKKETLLSGVRAVCVEGRVFVTSALSGLLDYSENAVRLREV
jgi:hypothetical protein